VTQRALARLIREFLVQDQPATLGDR
jgi:hypothetical protein